MKLNILRKYFEEVLRKLWSRYIYLNRRVSFYTYLCLKYGILPKELYYSTLHQHVLILKKNRVVLEEADSSILVKIGLPARKWSSVDSFVKAVSREVKSAQNTETKLNFVELIVLRNLLKGRSVRVGASTFTKLLKLYSELLEKKDI